MVKYRHQIFGVFIMKTKEYKQNRDHVKAIHQIYSSSKENGECQYINQTKTELRNFYESNEFNFSFLHNRYRDLLFRQKLEGSNFMSFTLGLLPCVITGVIDLASDLSSLFLCLIFIFLLILNSITCVFYIEWASKSYKSIFMSTRRLYIEPFELQLIEETMRKQHQITIPSFPDKV